MSYRRMLNWKVVVSFRVGFPFIHLTLTLREAKTLDLYTPTYEVKVGNIGLRYAVDSECYDVVLTCPKFRTTL